MADKDKMLKGLAELEKILKDVKSGKSKSKPPIDVTTKKGMDKAIREISKMEMGGEVIDMTKSQPVSMMEEGGQAISDADRDKVKKLLRKKTITEFGFDTQGNEVKMPKTKKPKRGSAPFITPGQQKLMDKVLGKGKPMEAAMGGPVKKMNMGGVVPGRGGSFKGVK